MINSQQMVRKRQESNSDWTKQKRERGGEDSRCLELFKNLAGKSI